MRKYLIFLSQALGVIESPQIAHSGTVARGVDIDGSHHE
jgi:hypothetical protein